MTQALADDARANTVTKAATHVIDTEFDNPLHEISTAATDLLDEAEGYVEPNQALAVNETEAVELAISTELDNLLNELVEADAVHVGEAEGDGEVSPVVIETDMLTLTVSPEQ